MSYADQPTMSPRKMVSIGLVVLLHALIGYAFITGLAYNVIKKAASDLKTVDIKDQPPPPEQKPPPPPPNQKVEPPPVVAPPPVVQVQTIAPPTIVTVPTAPPVVIHATAPPAPPAPPPPVISKAAGAKGDPAAWFSTDDYPPGALRENREGSVKITWQVNEQGRVENCQVAQSSGSPDLDDTSCKLIIRRGRYSPALDQGGRPMRSTASRVVTWKIPKE